MVEPPRRRRRSRIGDILAGLTLEELAPIGFVSILAFSGIWLFLKTTAQHMPTWSQIYDSITGRGAVGIVVVVVLLGIGFAFRRNL